MGQCKFLPQNILVSAIGVPTIWELCYSQLYLSIRWQLLTVHMTLDFCYQTGSGISFFLGGTVHSSMLQFLLAASDQNDRNQPTLLLICCSDGGKGRGIANSDSTMEFTRECNIPLVRRTIAAFFQPRLLSHPADFSL